MSPLKNIIISPEKVYPDETYWVNGLLNEGLDCFHIRKPQFTEKMMLDYIEAIDKIHRSRLVLHSYHHLAEKLGIQRLHFSENDRKNKAYKRYKNHFSLSTSVHSMDAFNLLDDTWQYAFLSPVFASISKQGYGIKQNVFQELKQRTNTATELIALGGISAENLYLLASEPIDGIALLGFVWQGNHPLKNYRLCKQTDLL
ncbi:thiamine phosphate synthase [Capnocytophaga felis]|uniref:Thiamine phosphate synthase n=1 Tax=Capnocytophaga felis TaxID=2267611 RepID=A0A5M4BA31_9FLAO|nr:thiamine phosphate synthase [Capnocytophaga felis]GET46458.1 thiamine phosphate synthase [Capnocytophaga felis]GET48348.1 thiamine phosphate synthase [Capnocytophaga felis]